MNSFKLINESSMSAPRGGAVIENKEASRADMTLWKKSVLVLAAVSGCWVTTGCAPVILGGVALTTATVAADRRTSTRMVNDEVLEKETMYDIAREKMPESHITVTAYGGKVLLTGEVATAAHKARAGTIASQQPDCLHVQNELFVGPVSENSQRLKDTLLATKVRSALLATQDVPFKQLKVVVDRSIVYLMGIVTPYEQDLAGRAAANVSGVSAVKLCFNIESPKEIRERFSKYKNKPSVK